MVAWEGKVAELRAGGVGEREGWAAANLERARLKLQGPDRPPPPKPRPPPPGSSQSAIWTPRFLMHCVRKSLGQGRSVWADEGGIH